MPTQDTDQSFAFEGQTAEGRPLKGSIDAPDPPAAVRQLDELRVRVVRLAPATRPARPAALSGQDLLAFNQQLAQLTRAGLPVEKGLRLIAQDLRSGRLATTVGLLADDLERGVPLAEALARHRGRFPPLYAALVDAGVRSSNLHGLLLNLGRHLELVQRLRGAIWRATAYPLMVVAGMAIIVLFLSMAVIPQFRLVFNDFGVQLPKITQLLLSSPNHLVPAMIGFLVVVILVVMLSPVARATGLDGPISDMVALRLPLIGPILRRNLVARWCDAMRLGVQAGMDLPAALRLTGSAVGSTRLKRDSEELARRVEAAEPLEVAEARPAGGRRIDLVPATVTASIELAAAHGDLPATLDSLAELYQQQAETRLSMLPVLLTPALLLLIAGVVLLIIIAMFAPLVSLLQSVGG